MGRAYIDLYDDDRLLDSLVHASTSVRSPADLKITMTQALQILFLMWWEIAVSPTVSIVIALATPLIRNQEWKYTQTRIAPILHPQGVPYSFFSSHVYLFFAQNGLSSRSSRSQLTSLTSLLDRPSEFNPSKQCLRRSKHRQSGLWRFLSESRWIPHPTRPSFSCSSRFHSK